MITRCGSCSGEFEAARQPNCPLCGAARPRPKLRSVPAPVDVTQVLQTLPPDPAPVSRRQKKKLKRRALNIGKDAAAAILASPPVERPAGPPPVDRPVPPPPSPQQAAPSRETSPPRPADANVAPVVPIAAGPPPIEVEYVFGGAIPDAIVPVMTIAVLPPRPEEIDVVEDTDPAPVSNLLDRARRTLRKG